MFDRWDVAYLWACPLVEALTRIDSRPSNFVPLDHHLEFSNDFADIIQHIRSKGLHLSYHAEVATINNLFDVCKKRPKVLHVDCHGTYRSNKFHLAFETASILGLLDAVSMERLKQMVNESNSSANSLPQIELG